MKRVKIHKLKSNTSTKLVRRCATYALVKGLFNEKYISTVAGLNMQDLIKEISRLKAIE